jgi:hypothetical protein
MPTKQPQGSTLSATAIAQVNENTLSADLKGGISDKFKSDSVAVKLIDQHLELVAVQTVWELLPPKQHKIVLRIKESLKAGNHSFGTDNDEIVATYFTPNQAPEVFKAIRGTLDLEFDPTEDLFVGSLTFEAVGIGSPDKMVSVENGQFVWRK